jgi:hypothetical protein
MENEIIKSSNELVEKSKDRLAIIDRINTLEENGMFDVDPENDPPTIILTPDNVDYLRSKTTSKVKTTLANKLGKRFLNELLKDNKLIIKDINGIENLNSIKNGAVLTCNHFNPFDVFTVENVFRKSTLSKKKKLYKVIREGNYTNFPRFIWIFL